VAGTALLIRYAAAAALLGTLAGCAAPATPNTVSTAQPSVGTSTRPASPGADRALIDAASRGDLAGVRTALAEGANVRAMDGEGATALVRAAYGNHVEVAEALLEAGSDPNHQDRTQQSAYLIATADVGDDPRLLELTLTHGADVASLDSYRGTGLIRAADRGHERIVARLLTTGVDIDHVNRLGWTALLEAVILGRGDAAHERVVAQLLAAGAQRGIRDGDGLTALDHARRAGFTGMVALLQAPAGWPPSGG